MCNHVKVCFIPNVNANVFLSKWNFVCWQDGIFTFEKSPCLFWHRGGRTMVVRVRMSWWRHQMETLSALLALCEGNSPVPGEFPSQRPATQSFDLSLNKRFSKPSRRRWFDTPSRSLWRHCNTKDIFNHQCKKLDGSLGSHLLTLINLNHSMDK